MVQIYFDTATYDVVEKDQKVMLCFGFLTWDDDDIQLIIYQQRWQWFEGNVIFYGWFNQHCDTAKSNLKVTMEAQLGLIGGTMGLLTGFSILRCLHRFQQQYDRD